MAKITMLNYKADNETFYKLGEGEETFIVQESWHKGNAEEHVLNFDMREQDVFVNGFMKSGTTWIKELVYLLMNNIDFEKAKSGTTSERVPLLVHLMLGSSSGEGLPQVPDPRLYKLHHPFYQCPKQLQSGIGKMIYIARNPKDVIVSWYFYAKNHTRVLYSGSLQDVVTQFVNSELLLGPWHQHVLSFWKRRENDNILFIKYEDMTNDVNQVIKTVADFLNIQVNQEQIEQIARYISFDEMKQNDSVNYSWAHTKGELKPVEETGFTFMRKGKVGDWKNHFSPEMSAMVDEYCERTIKPYGLEFQYE